MARDQLKIQRKRDMFEERRQRILNAKVRLIGLDVQTLNEQVKEKERLRQEEKEADRFARKLYLFLDKTNWHLCCKTIFLFLRLRYASNGN